MDSVTRGFRHGLYAHSIPQCIHAVARHEGRLGGQNGKEQSSRILGNNPPPPDYKQALAYIYSLAYNFCLLIFGTPLFPRKKMALLDTNDPHLFYDDIAAAREEDEAVAEDFYEAATDVEDTGSVSAQSNEGVEEHAGVGKTVADKACLCLSFCLRLASEFAILPCLLMYETSQI